MTEKLYLTGSKGRLFAILQKPELAEGEKCPLVILLHGFMANGRMEPIPSIAKALEAKGIATLRIDFNGHGKSEGKFSDMTVLNEIDDAMMVYDYVQTLDFVSKVALAGHSQGGVVSSMMAGLLGSEKISCVVLLCAAAVLHDDCLNGCIMGSKFNPQDPPERLWVFFHRLGKKYITVGQKLKIYETAAEYDGPVLLIHGTADTIVPISYSEKYNSIYKNSKFVSLEGETHFLNKRRGEVVAETVDFLVGNLL